MAITDELLSKNEKYQEWAKKYKEEHPDAKDEDILAAFRATKDYKDLEAEAGSETPEGGKGTPEERPEGETVTPKGEKADEGKPEGGKGQPKGGKDGENHTLNIGGEGKPGGGEGALPNFWKEWAEKKNYAYEDNDAGDYDYACTIYEKAEDKAAGKDPVVSVKAKGDTMLVKSDRLEVYQEIAKQAKEHGYTNVNFMDNMPENQQKLMLIACLEQGLKVSGKVPEYLPVEKEQSEELAGKIHSYNINSFKKKYQGKEEPITLPDGDKEYKLSALCGAMLAGAKLAEDHQDIVLQPRTFMASLPEIDGKKSSDFMKYIANYNRKSAENIVTSTKKMLAEKPENVDALVAQINEEKNPYKKAILWAACKSNGVPADKLPDISETLNDTRGLPMILGVTKDDEKLGVLITTLDEARGTKGKPKEQTHESGGGERPKAPKNQGNQQTSQGANTKKRGESRQ